VGAGAGARGPVIVPYVDIEEALAEPAELDVQAIKLLAELRAREIAIELLGNPNRGGRGELRWRRKGSFTMDMRPGHAGRWFDHEAGQGGDLLALVQCELAVDFRTAVEWLASKVGMGEMTADDLSALIANRGALSAARAAQDEQDRAERIALAREVWRASVPPSGTPVQAYLEGRRCWHSWLADGSAIRWNPATPMGGGRFPCMVAVMTNAATGEPCGIHRTHILPDGSGKGPQGKKMLGPSSGAVVRLRNQPGEIGAVGEGIESTLSGVALNGRNYPVVCAAMNAGNLKQMQPFAPVNKWSVFADLDEVGIKAALHFADSCEAIGVQFEVLIPSDDYADFNDAVLTKKSPALASKTGEVI
jgi:putative DNA primase/helicase